MAPENSLRTEYCAQVLKLDPTFEADRILELRRKRKEGRLTTESDERGHAHPGKIEQQVTRRQAEQALENAAQNFWEEDEQTLSQRLKALELENFPELHRYRNRLLRVLRHRNEFNYVLTDNEVELHIIDSLRNTLVASEKESSRIIRSITQEPRHPNVVKRIQRFSRRIRRDHPELFSLAERWFEKFETIRRDKRDSRGTRPSKITASAILFMCIGIPSVIKLVVTLVKWISEMR